ncbi:MAG: hypothetical protein I3I98_08545 [Mobilibacterium timonense]|uniref:hypothetical protein n=1 Tax=Mobilibacterium timonense TaxID=1871012 RepID=UPI002357061D|nr:hypothetical protein [Mobilibacterium timonense]MBM6991421.1 hypothetical protein [Mobilibacterium timonense]
METTFNVLGIRIMVQEVPVVDKYESSLGRYDPLTNTITLDESLPRLYYTPFSPHDGTN